MKVTVPETRIGREDDLLSKDWGVKGSYKFWIGGCFGLRWSYLWRSGPEPTCFRLLLETK